jgi:hypothetical protein
VTHGCVRWWSLAVLGSSNRRTAFGKRWHRPSNRYGCNRFRPTAYAPRSRPAGPAVILALGGDRLADIGVLRSPPEPFGPVASHPTCRG